MRERAAPANRKDVRNRQVVEMRDRGATYSEIGRHFGFSYDRARQIVTNTKQLDRRRTVFACAAILGSLRSTATD